MCSSTEVIVFDDGDVIVTSDVIITWLLCIDGGWKLFLFLAADENFHLLPPPRG